MLVNSAVDLYPALLAIFAYLIDPIPLLVPINFFFASGSKCCFCCNTFISSSDNLDVIVGLIKYSSNGINISSSSNGLTFNILILGILVLKYNIPRSNNCKLFFDISDCLCQNDIILTLLTHNLPLTSNIVLSDLRIV